MVENIITGIVGVILLWILKVLYNHYHTLDKKIDRIQFFLRKVCDKLGIEYKYDDF